MLLIKSPFQLVFKFLKAKIEYKSWSPWEKECLQLTAHFSL